MTRNRLSGGGGGVSCGFWWKLSEIPRLGKRFVVVSFFLRMHFSPDAFLACRAEEMQPKKRFFFFFLEARFGNRVSIYYKSWLLIWKYKFYSSCDTSFLHSNRKGIIRLGEKRTLRGRNKKEVELDLQSPNLANTLREGGVWAKWAVEIWTEGRGGIPIKIELRSLLSFSST